MLKVIRYIAILEGISFLSFVITMPLKYGWDIRTPNYYVGQIHGLLFLTYCVLIILGANEFKWLKKKTFTLLLCSIIPGGTFWGEKRYLRDSDTKLNATKNKNEKS